MTSEADHTGWGTRLARAMNPSVPWCAALGCNLLTGAALVLLVMDPDRNLRSALVFLGLAAVVLYGTAWFVHR